MAVDNDRMEAFRIIIEDIEQNGDRYNNKSAQSMRIAELIAARGLRMKPKGEQVQTPTAARLRDALREWASRSKASSKNADVFSRGRAALDTARRTKLGLAEAMEDERPSSEQTLTNELGGEADTTSAQHLQATASRSADLPDVESSKGPVPIAIEDSEGSDLSSVPTTSPRISTVSGHHEATTARPVDDGSFGRSPSRSKRSVSSAFGEEVVNGAGAKAKRHKPRQASSAAKLLDHLWQQPSKDASSLKRKLQESGEEPARRKRPKRAAAPSDLLDASSSDAENEGAANLLNTGTAGKESKSMAKDSNIAAPTSMENEHQSSDSQPQSAQQQASTLDQNEARPNMPAEGRPVVPLTAVSSSSRLRDTGLEGPQNLRASTSEWHTRFRQIRYPPAVPKVQTGYPEGLQQVDAKKDVDTIIWRIRNANAELLEQTGIRDAKASMSHSPNPDLAALYARVLPRPNIGSWKDRAMRLMNDGLDLDYWLNACAGAAIYEEVLTKPVPWRTPQQLLGDMKHAKWYFERLIRALGVRDDHLGNIEYILFRAGEQQIQEGSDFEREYISPVAEELAVNFMMLLVQQIKHARPDVQIPEPALESAKSSYTEVFKDALFLRGRCEVGPDDFDFVWEPPMAKFDRVTMTDVRGWDKHATSVQVCTFAAIRTRDDKEPEGWWYHSRARTYAYAQESDTS
ncbi:hypothetical protein CKM354_000663400 [Cercospora kikuchii]|uniref:Uncharacterized protein n=1 Tax=Cercospora kikuchii TaxID=84275 RepID=A0A9P3CIK2_9PEZI|nr:uncharacterized protein CKM354_000663400 [Cercospora kikuchii]GIZ43406.1 hypothetical protein CKM354_000663400 [Cercospora kikuchii]